MSLSIKFPEDHYLGMISRKNDTNKDFLPLGFLTPNGSDKAADKRKASVDQWVDYNSRSSPRKFISAVLKNEAMAGFRLLDDIKRGSSWGSGNVKWRVEDPRGFELEITSPNLMQILACTVVDSGEILDMCMWAREGSENVLVPVSSDVYKAAIVNTARASKSASMRDLRIGDTAILQNGVMGRYFGRMNAVEHDYRKGNTAGLRLRLVPRHIFVNSDDKMIHIIGSPKLSEIVTGEEMDRETSEYAIAALIAGKDYKVSGGAYFTYAYTFSKNVPSVVRDKLEVNWNDRNIAFEVDGVCYTQQFSYIESEIVGQEISKSAWLDKSLIHLLPRTYSTNYNKFLKNDLIARGIKCYKAFSRITTEKGAVFIVEH